MTQAATWAQNLPLHLAAFHVPAVKVAANQHSKRYRFPDGSEVSVRPQYGPWRWGFYIGDTVVFR